MGKIKIVLVDDHNIVRDGLKHLLMNLQDIEVIAEAANENELFKLLHKIKPDILLMDVTMPKMSGIDITQKVYQDYPQIKVIMLSANYDDKFVYDSFNAGALGYLPKNIQFEELVEAIKSVYEGKEYIAKSIVDVVLKNYINRSFLSSEKITAMKRNSPNEKFRFWNYLQKDIVIRKLLNNYIFLLIRLNHIKKTYSKN